MRKSLLIEKHMGDSHRLLSIRPTIVSRLAGTHVQCIETKSTLYYIIIMLHGYYMYGSNYSSYIIIVILTSVSDLTDSSCTVCNEKSGLFLNQRATIRN